MSVGSVRLQYRHGTRTRNSRTAAPVRRLPESGPSGYWVIFSLSSILALLTAEECHSITSLPSLLYGSVLWVWWGCVASTVWKFGRTSRLLTRFSSRMVAIHVFLGALLGVVHLLLLGSLSFVALYWRTHKIAPDLLVSLLSLNRFGLELLIYGFVLGLTGIVRSHMHAQNQAMRAVELERELSAAHLRALQMQIEPHFLFNTLNAITALTELGRQKDAADMLSRLSAILKSTLQRNTPEKIPLSLEIEIVENYLAIEQVRFADRLRVNMDVDRGALDALVPCFLLQPIVENAIRHGVARCESEGLVEASVRRDGATLRLVVRDSGDAIAAPKPCALAGHGIGLNNTRERLAHFYRDQYTMNAHALAAGGFEVSISIPYERVRM
jgi:sensor histidine kinase YesM